MRAATGMVVGLAGLALFGWGAALIVKVSTGGTPDASRGAIVGIGVVGVSFGALLAVAAVAMIASWRR